jgi:phosphatidylserine decarboxylase precursor-related protein
MRFFSVDMLWLIILLVIITLVAAWLFFHRDPDITVKRFDGYLSPADGIIGEIIDVRSDRQFIKKHNAGITAFLSDARWAKTIVVIKMYPHHIHTQRAPADGKVASVLYKPGTLLNAVMGDWLKATFENEHVCIAFSGKKPCKVYLIAGGVARRIKTRVTVGEHVKQGRRIGSIALGSQVALALPKCMVMVEPGERVYVGKTRVAR